MSKSFCVLPWIFQAIRNNGSYRVCCQANQGPLRGLLRDEQDILLRANINSLDQAKNARLMKNIREDMLNEKWPSECVRCQREELSGLKSRRVVENEIWKDQYNLKMALEDTLDGGEILPEKVPTRYIDVRFGNYCNLKCRSCGPTDSSAWYDDHAFVWGIEYFEDSYEKVNLEKSKSGKYISTSGGFNWFKSKEFWSDLESHSHHLQHLHIVGGEPLLIGEHYKFLENCIERGIASNIILEYNTNLTILPERILKIWENFKMVKLGISIDGVDRVNTYIRYPSDWNKLISNMLVIDSSQGNIVPWIAHTVMALNILNFPEFIDWRVKMNFKKIQNSRVSPIVTAHPLHSPNFLNIKVFPEKIKQAIESEVLKKMESLKETIFENYKDNTSASRFWKSSESLVYHYLKFMNSEDYSHLFGKFMFHSRKLDEKRKQKIEDYLPELYTLIRNHL